MGIKLTRHLRLASSFLAAYLACAPQRAAVAQAGPAQSTVEYVKATWYSLFSLDPDGALSSAPKICIDSPGLAIGDSDPRDIGSIPDRDTTTVAFLESIGQYVVDAADCWSPSPDTTYATLYVQGAITRRRAPSGGDSVSVAVFKLYRARPCGTTVLPRCALPVAGAATIYVTGKVTKTPGGWPPMTLRRVYPDF